MFHAGHSRQMPGKHALNKTYETRCIYGQSPQQHAFRSGHSTIDSIQEVVEAVRIAENHNHWLHQRPRVSFLVTLVVRKDFNSARWADML